MNGTSPMKHSQDPLWEEYSEALDGLARIPSALYARSEKADAEYDSALASARSAREMEAQRCQEWKSQARRTIANAHARLVASGVLIPDCSQIPPTQGNDPETLSNLLREQDAALIAALEKLQSARRKARLHNEAKERETARHQAKTRRIIIVTVTLVALLLMAWVVF